MSEKIKKILIIILFIIIVILLAGFLYFIFFKKPIVPPVVLPEEKPEVIIPRLPVSQQDWKIMTVEQRIDRGLPAIEWPIEKEEILPEVLPSVERIVPKINEIADGGRTWITPVSFEPVKGATLAFNGVNSIYYDQQTGHFYEIDSLGSKKLLTDQVFYDVENIVWSPSKSQAIIEYPDGFKVMYDFNKKRQYTLPKNWQEFSWDSSGSRIVFKSMSKYPENTWLAVARPDGSQAKPIEHMGDNADKVTVSWSPNNQVVAFSATGQPRGVWEQEMLLIGLHGENFKSLVVDGRGFEPKWSPQGDKIAYSVYSVEFGYQPRLYIVNAQGDEIGRDKKNVNLATWAHKCTFNQSGSILYCAVPKDLPEGAGMIPELAKNTRDDFYKVNVGTGEVSFLAEGAMGGYNVSEIYLSKDEDILYFVDKNTEKLRYLRLK